jgi:hypothetical protein
MGKKSDRLNAWEISLIHTALVELARSQKNETSKSQTFALSETFLNAKGVTVTHGT